MTVTAAPELRLHHVLRDARLAAGLTQTELAQRADVNQSSISRWERGQGAPDVFEMRRIAQATEADYLNDLRLLPSRCFIGLAGTAA